MNNKTVVWSAACQIFDLLVKGEPILGSAYALPNIGSLLPNKSDDSRQNNRIISYLILEDICYSILKDNCQFARDKSVRGIYFGLFKFKIMSDFISLAAL